MSFNVVELACWCLFFGACVYYGLRDEEDRV